MVRYEKTAKIAGFDVAIAEHEGKYVVSCEKLPDLQLSIEMKPGDDIQAIHLGIERSIRAHLLGIADNRLRQGGVIPIDNGRARQSRFTSPLGNQQPARVINLGITRKKT